MLRWGINFPQADLVLTNQMLNCMLASYLHFCQVIKGSRSLGTGMVKYDPFKFTCSSTVHSPTLPVAHPPRSSGSVGNG